MEEMAGSAGDRRGDPCSIRVRSYEKQETRGTDLDAYADRGAGRDGYGKSGAGKECAG